MKDAGVDQWQDGYPDVTLIEQDIAEDAGYILFDAEQSKAIGYACFSFAGEPSYDSIDGTWLSNGDYMDIHRMAIDSAKKGKGLSGIMFKEAEKLCLEHGVNSIKIRMRRTPP